MNTTNLVVERTFNAPIERVWEAWVNPTLIMQWWGPDNFTSPSAEINFQEGGRSVVCMKAPLSFGGQDFYNTWAYTKIEHLQSIEFIQNLSDKDGNKIDPSTVGMPSNFPIDTRTVVTFEDYGNDKTNMTIIEYSMPESSTEMGKRAEMGLNQTIDKMKALLEVA